VPVRPSPTLIVVADGYPLAIAGIRQVLRDEREFVVGVCASTEAETRDALARHEPDVLVLDLQIPPRGALQLLAELSTTHPATRVVLLNDERDPGELLEAVRLGARGIVPKRMAAQLLVPCLRGVCRDGQWIERGSLTGLVASMVERESALGELRQRLTRRELEIVRLVGCGLRNKDITTRLDISEGTVKIHLHNIYEKLGTNDRVHLALRARGVGLA